jgi:effector-binding domain-containing protein
MPGSDFRIGACRPIGRLLAASVAILMLLATGPIQAQDTAPAAQGQPIQAAPTPVPDPDRDMDPDAATPLPLLPGDAFGAEVTLPARTIVYLKGHSTWDAAFATLVNAFTSLNDYLAQHDLKPTGPLLTIYTKTDDSGFSFEAAAPVTRPPSASATGNFAVGPAPAGKALKFVHRGSYDAMDSTYEAITNYLDDKQLDAKDLFIEEYVSDPVKSDPKKLVINVYVPVK